MRVIALTQQKSIDDQKLATRIASLKKETKLYISILSIYEMEYGAAHASEQTIAVKTKLAIQSLKIEDKITILPLSMQGAQIFGEIKELYRTIKGIGKKALQKHNVDLIIAATAIEHQATLVSHDNKDKIFEILA
ncbi:type II toxin-antitoxin system VapC family toxin [Candidatus Parabeggiatoa sp. HSG14]|uniref:type II toxin-antitoxin system VapC family toxin n=1 Tax=Candidatus Parabeggiatoa sp. HSG14 TaxID=3055593 RepID=UPI0025A7B8D0|nr:type II toxin-antitoxin system VapC family toxin [Thiotrichales bacterium HSG14]